MTRLVKTALSARLFLSAAMLCVSIALAAGPATAVDVERIDQLVVGWGIKDLPDNPDTALQIAAGETEIEIQGQIDPGLDADKDTVDYLNRIEAKLVAASTQKPLYPIRVHTSRFPVSNAQALPGGEIIFYEKTFQRLDNESQLAGVLAHETAHELHDDFLKFWHDYKTGRSYYGSGGVMEESEEMEAAADATGVHLAYQAGWDPEGMLAEHVSLYKQGVMERRGEPEFYSAHPRERERVQAIRALIAQLPPKEGLIKDTPEFQEVKAKY